MIIFDQPAIPRYTAGQQAQDRQEAALQQAAEEELRKAEESMKGQIDAVTKAGRMSTRLRTPTRLKTRAHLPLC